MILCSQRVTKALALLALFGSLLALATGALACSCIPASSSPPKAVSEFLTLYKTHKIAIFLGKVIFIRNSWNEKITTFAVNSYWHSSTPIPSEIELESELTDCRYPFKEGQTYLVFASKYRECGWDTDACSPTTSDPSPYLKILGTGQKPVATPKETTPIPYARIVVLILVFLAGRVYYLTVRQSRHKPTHLPPSF